MKTDAIRNVLEFEREHLSDGMNPDVLDQAFAQLTALEAENAELKQERDLAVAHDRQPYPTADAYEKVCAANEKKRKHINAGLLCKDAHPNGCPFADLPENHTIGDHPSFDPKAPRIEDTLRELAETVPEEDWPPTGKVLVSRSRMEKALESLRGAIDSDNSTIRGNVLKFMRNWLAALLKEESNARTHQV